MTSGPDNEPVIVGWCGLWEPNVSFVDQLAGSFHQGAGVRRERGNMMLGTRLCLDTHDTTHIPSYPATTLCSCCHMQHSICTLHRCVAAPQVNFEKLSKQEFVNMCLQFQHPVRVECRWVGPCFYFAEITTPNVSVEGHGKGGIQPLQHRRIVGRSALHTPTGRLVQGCPKQRMVHGSASLSKTETYLGWNAHIQQPPDRNQLS